MASKVNTRFVIILCAALVVVGAGVGGAYYMFKMRSGEHYVTLGDKAMKEGKIDAADSWYERAVGKEPFNVEWLKKWRSAREQIVPKTQNAYVTAYRMYHGILHNLAQAQKTNIDAHRDYLEMIYLECSFGGSRGSWEFLANSVDESLTFFQTDAENPSPPALRRYRGLALTELLVSDPNFPKDRIDLARQDLEAALKSDPKDGWVANALALWHRFAAQRAKTAGDDAAAKLQADRVRQVLTDFVAANPSDAVGQLGLLSADLIDIERLDDPIKSPGANVKVKTAAAQALAPRLAPLINSAKASPNLSSQVVNQIAAIAPNIDPKNGREAALALLNDILAKDPGNMDALLFSAQLIAQSDPPDVKGMIDAYQKIIDLKDKPVSLDGVRLLTMRNRARFAQASASLQALAGAKDDAERKSLGDAARNFRNELARNIAEDSPELLFIDGKTALIDAPANIPKARLLLSQFLKAPGDTAQTVMLEASLLMADVGMRSTPPEPGLARENLIRVLNARPTSIEVRGMLAQVERSLGNFEAAEAQLRLIIDMDPGNEAAKSDLQTLAALTSTSSDIKVDDPVMKTLIEAQRLASPAGAALGNEQAALVVLEKGLETHNHDPRIVLAVVTSRFRAGDRDAARLALKTGLERNPDESKPGVANLKDLDRRLKAADTLEGSIAFIDEAKLPEVDRQLLLHSTYLEFKKPDEAAAALAQAEKLSPDHPRIVEMRFQTALSATPPDTAKGSEIADRAARLNLDQAEGDTYRARVQIAQKAFREAAATLARAVERGNAPAGVYRLLGLVQAELGRTQDAMASFRRAIDLVPNDLLTIKMFLSVLIKSGEQNEAVAVARKSQFVGRGDTEFLNLWLALEARSGRTAFARDRREEIYERNPKDTNNAAALAEICLEQKAWDRARQLIDKLRAAGDELRLAMLDARWHADKGDIRQANQTLREYIGKLTEAPDKLAAYMAFGQFLLQRGFQREGLAALRQAVQFQDPATMAVDLMLGDVQISLGQFEEAEASYRRVLDAQVPDPDLRIRKRLIEALNQQQKFAEAEAVIVKIGAAADGDVEILAQRANAARGLGNIKLAREYLDKAVTKFPDEPMPYLRRARLVAQDPALMSDAMADLATAIRLRPGFWQALRTRAMIHLGEGKSEEGVRDLKEAVERNPGLDDLRIEYLDYLVRFGMENEAVDAADAALALRPNDARLMGQFAGVFARSGRWGRAARYYKMLWDQLRDEASALSYCNALLGATPPGLSEADAVLAVPEIKTESSWRLLLLRAVVRNKQAKDAAARTDIVASFDLLGADGPAVLDWCEGIRALYVGGADRLALLNSVRVPAQIEEWVVFARARISMEDPKNFDEVISTLRALRDRVLDNKLRGLIQLELSLALARQSKWSECLDEIRLGLQFRPNDAMLLNNAAAILSEKLQKPREALPFAERAQMADPTNFNYADTLAVTHWELGDKAQALRKMADALRLAPTEADKATAAIKLARWKLQAGDPQGARSMLDLVREMTTDSPALKDVIKSELESLASEINAK